MKKQLLCLLSILSIMFAFGQIEKPAKWTYQASKKEVKIGEIIELTFSAELNKGWYMYSVGPYETAPSTTFTFEKNNTYELVGTIQPQKAKHKVDEYIGEYDYFTEKAVFTQKIKIVAENTSIKGSYEFSTCSLESGICLPPKDEDFVFDNFKIVGALAIGNEETPKTETKNIQLVNNLPSSISSEMSAEDKNEKVVANDSLQKVATIDSTASLSTPNSAMPLGESSNLFGFFILAFLSGLIALLTPCVFPMIPMTVTFFLNSGKTRTQGIVKALVYGFSIILIYTLIGTLVSKLAGPEAANFLSTHWLPNLFFFGTFILFALSFLGLFEIVLPSGLINATDRQADKGGYLGIFFMAFTLVLVSFSCTGPIVGTILVQSANGEFLKPLVGMFGFSLAFAVPFTLFAIFPSWLGSLPKSGGWLNTVKVVLGFLELALAFKFLSLADQAYHWNLLDRDINIAIWIAIFASLSMYLFGFITLPHDDKVEKTSVPRLILGIVSLSFSIYLIAGLWGAPLKPLSGYLPPLASQDFILMDNKLGSSTISASTNAKYSDFLHLPHQLQGYFDYNEAIAAAKKYQKPIFIDFTGHGCVNCREMEANVWSDPQVLRRLQNDFIVLALYVDDKTELPESEWYTSTFDMKVKKSIGKQNADFQIKNYNTNAQPYYLVVNSEGKTLSGPQAYDLKVANFVNFLDEGKRKF
ncbi:MAG: protein-disulfide reductase DsbD family protein [Cytophagales bacterium]